MKKTIEYLACITVLISLFSSAVFAQTPLVNKNSKSGSGSAGVIQVAPDSMIIPNPVTNSPVFGQDHSYSVVFRGNGEAVVTLRVAFTNTSSSALKSFILRVPKVIPTQLSTYQILLDKYCYNWGPQIYDPMANTYVQGNCIRYQEPDYYQSYYSSAKYQRANTTFSGDMITVDLPTAVAPNASGAFFLNFRAMGYAAKDSFKVFNYKFETLKVEDSIRNLRVGISTDSDLVLKGVTGTVNYRFEAPAAALGGVESASAPVANPTIDQFVGNIGNGSITKTASNLSSLESYTVEGAYAQNKLQLYGKTLLIVTVIILVILLVLIMVVRKIFKKLNQSDKQSSYNEIETGERKTTTVSLDVKYLMMVFLLSFLASILMAGYTVGIIFLSQFMTSVISYQYEVFFFLFLVIISFCIYSFLLFGPAIYMGIKKGIGWGIASVGLTVTWLIMFLIIGLLFVFLINPKNPVNIYPMIYGSSTTKPQQ